MKMRSMTEPLRFHDAARAELERSFGLTAFRPGQAEVVVGARRAHVVAVMPTGGGKSLCYQLPARDPRRDTLVVSRSSR